MQVKKCAKFFYGTLKVYSEALDHSGDLEGALKRNLYGSKNPGSLKDLVIYVKECDQFLKAQDFKKYASLAWPSFDEKRNTL